MSDKKSPQKNRRSWSDRWFDWRSRRSFEGNRNKSKRLVVTEDSAGKAPSSDYTEVDTNLPPDLIVPAHIGIIMDGNGAGHNVEVLSAVMVTEQVQKISNE